MQLTVLDLMINCTINNHNRPHVDPEFDSTCLSAGVQVPSECPSPASWDQSSTCWPPPHWMLQGYKEPSAEVKGRTRWVIQKIYGSGYYVRNCVETLEPAILTRLIVSWLTNKLWQRITAVAGGFGESLRWARNTDLPGWESWGETRDRRPRWSSGRRPLYEPPPGSAQSHVRPFPTAAPGSLVHQLGRREERETVLNWEKKAES